MPEPAVLYEVDGHIATVTFNRPEARNAVNPEVIVRLADAWDAIDSDGRVTTFFRGLGRPQGLAFDTDRNLYVAACYRGRHGIVQISPDASSIKQFVAGNNIVGLCFTRGGDMIIATNDTVYSLPVGIHGTLLT